MAASASAVAAATAAPAPVVAGRSDCTLTSNGSVDSSTLMDRRNENASFNSRWAFRISSNCSCDSRLFSSDEVASVVKVRKF